MRSPARHKHRTGRRRFPNIARDNKERPAWIHGWLMDPHPPMPEIMLSRQQISNILAYLDSLPAQQIGADAR